MINEKLTKIKINKKNLEKISNSITIHLGKNPRKGGNPPKDRRGSPINNFMNLFFKEKENIWFKLKSLKFLKIKIIENDKNE